MVQVLDKARGALMLDEVPKTIRSAGRDFVAHGPITAVINVVDRGWNNMGRRIDHIAGTNLSQGGPLR